MEKIKVTIPSKAAHNYQTISGFLMLKEQGWDVELIDRSADPACEFAGMAVVQAEYCGKKIIYDHWDGYQDAEAIKKGLEWADVYFKRSFSAEKNQALFPELSEKMFPLGFNYHLTHRDNPLEAPLWKEMIKRVLGHSTGRYFTAEVFEGRAEAITGAPRILFLARLWDDRDAGLSDALKAERREINRMRVDIIRALKERYAENFIGGLNDCPLSRELAPDLIMPNDYTNRKKYLQLVHSCDICIGSMGLHESIGWKTGEYVAAAKAIVNETLRYSVPGDFAEGKNYLAFSNAVECVQAVEALAGDPEKLFAMKKANEEYYREYLRPDVLVKNTLEKIK